VIGGLLVITDTSEDDVEGCVIVTVKSSHGQEGKNNPFPSELYWRLFFLILQLLDVNLLVQISNVERTNDKGLCRSFADALFNGIIYLYHYIGCMFAEAQNILLNV